jgi:asparagine synthase (glutamine-hydrolysing)
MNVPQRVRTVGWLLRAQGPGWLAFRARHHLSRRSGLLRLRLPAAPWGAHPLAAALADPCLARPDDYLAYRRGAAPAFFFEPGDRPGPAAVSRWDERGARPLAEAEELRAGVFRYFGRTPLAVGDPPPWHTNPWSGRSLPADRHWTGIGDFDDGDIKAVWEPSRFGFAYALVRAYARTGDEAHPETFWRLLESWRAANPPQLGPNWKCGQEVGLRVMAWCFALVGFLRARATTPERGAGLAQMVAVSGQRIERNLAYALSQRNNHGVTEGLGLWTVGALFPEFRDARRWEAKGRRVLESLGRDLIDDDGAFAQHSLNYQRVALQAYLWAVRLGDRHGRTFSDALRRRLARAADLVYQLQDGPSGSVPNYGHNDGALIVPLNNCDARDYRPVLQAARYLETGTRLYGEGPWDEDLYWLFGPEALTAPAAPAPRGDLRAATGGYYTLRGRDGFAFTRCARFRHRPAQADLLHVDVWWRGLNVALDPGTYSYNAPAPWDNGLAQTACHNTVTVDGLDQMDRAGRFLWLPWARGVVRRHHRSAGGSLAYWEGGHDGYRRLRHPATHRRAVVQLGDEHWLVLDDLTSRSGHDYRLHWLLPDWPYVQSEATLVLDSPAGPYGVRFGALGAPGRCSVVRAEPGGTRGWHSPYYLHREPAVSADLALSASSARFWTVLGPPVVGVAESPEGLTVDGPGWVARVTPGPRGGVTLVEAVTLSGAVNDTLELRP